MFTVAKNGDLSGVAKGLQAAAVRGQKSAGRAVAKDGRKIILDDVRSRRGSLRMMGTNLGVKTRVTAGPASSVVELYGSPAGPWTIVTKGTRSYTIKPRRKQVLARARGDVFGTLVERPRRGGRDYWSAAEAALDRGLLEVVTEAVDDEMMRAR